MPDPTQAPMTAEEMRAARKALGLTLAALGLALDVDERTIRRWEHDAPIPRQTAMLMRLALKYAPVRDELGIQPKAGIDEPVP